MSDLTRLPLLVRNFLPWLTAFALAGLAWILTLQQALQMHFLGVPMFGTMGLALGPFLWFWTLMMVAMMLPALAPTLAVRYQHARQRVGIWYIFFQIFGFLVGYLVIWALFGVPAFFLAQLGEQSVLHAPVLGTVLGVGLLVVAGLYQMTPLEKRYLTSCNPALCCSQKPQSTGTILAPVRDGLFHGMACLGCCGCLMLVMVTVGLMNLPWMLLLTILIFLEKTWQHGDRLGFFVGFGLLIFAALAAAEPALLPGLSRPLSLLLATWFA